MRSAIVLSLLALVLLAPLAEADEWSPVEVIEFQGIQSPGPVIPRIAKGEYDVGLFSLPAGDYRGLPKDLLKNLELYKTVVSYTDLTFNTYHDPDKEAPIVTVGNETYFNPFAIREVRFAMNYLISREYIAREVYEGSAAPMFSCVRPSHPADKYFEPVYAALNLTAEGNEELALQMMETAMEEAAEEVARYSHRLEKVNGTWHFDGRPVTVKLAVRTEDERAKLGIYIAEQLRKAGFAVEKIFLDRYKAGQLVFARPPSNYEWNVYTGGWFADKDASLWINDYAAWFYSAWYGYLPGRVEPKHLNTVTVMEFLRKAGNGDPDNGLNAIGAEYYGKASELGGILNWTEEELTRLLTNISAEVNGESYAITSAGQYWDLQKIAVGIGIMEGARIFLVEEWELSPVNRERVKGITPDPTTGILNRWSFLNARTPDGVLKVAYFVPTCGLCDSFNPVSGFDTHVFPANLWGLVHDPGIFLGPGGLYTPYRCNWTVERGNFTVPGSAVTYNQTRGWIAAHAGETADVKVTVTCDLGEWHDGVRMRMADIKYYIAFLYTWAYRDGPDDPYYDENLGDTAASLSKVLGFQFTGDGYVVYGSYAHPFADDLTTKTYVFYPEFPWELYYAMGELVANASEYGIWRGYSFTRNGRNVESLNIMAKEHAEDLARVLEVLKEQKAVPGAIAGDVADPGEGYARAIEWISVKGHAVISNGPFYIEKYEPRTLYLELRAFRGVSPIPSPAAAPTTSPKPAGEPGGSQSTATKAIYAIGIVGVLILALVLVRKRG
ncbi:peptide ABC transporter substrate-binding protein [Thermococcus indicus]|uniref:Peptide ABC transporter substrate-binding protein n=1 Tax=Thermococcus indicus TaxID=2586643 RepID=A0A4Y5SKN2_9EURY|nr:ABC transporter substrate-binding protein [Thermococcus indicus]QDA31453.1 peptide ABC transporter substrate-binding protein [Thermococcus indicus]